MNTRPYRLYDGKFWNSYTNLKAACWDLLVKLYTLNHLELYDQGYFEETIYINESHHKRYTVELLFPYTKLIIKKMTKGDLDQEEFMKTLQEVYKIFNERIQYKN